jgi:hypothetical protein
MGTTEYNQIVDGYKAGIVQKLNLKLKDKSVTESKGNKHKLQALL